MGKGFARSVQGKKLYINLVNLLMMGLKPLIKYLDYYKESEKKLHQFSWQQEMTWAKIDTMHTTHRFLCLLSTNIFLISKQPGLGMK